MKALKRLFVVLIGSYVTVLFALILLPVFLISDVAALEDMINYIYKQK